MDEGVRREAGVVGRGQVTLRRLNSTLRTMETIGRL